MSTLSKDEITTMLARYDGLKHKDVFESGWNQDLVTYPYADAWDDELPISRRVNVATRDVMTLYWALNTHCLMFSDLTGMSDRYVATYVRNKGILEYIAENMAIKDSLIKANVSTTDTWSLDNVDVPKGHPVCYILRNTQGVAPEVFTFLNWLKRTPFRNLNFKGYCIDKFLKNQDRLGSHLSKVGSSYKLITQAMAHIANCLLYGVKVSFDSFVLPPGQYLENLGNDFSYLKKWNQLSHYQNELPSYWKRFFDYSTPLPIPDYNHLLIVPKDYKTGRTICVESVWRTTMGYCMAEPMTRRLNRLDTYSSLHARTRNENGDWEYLPVGGAYYNYQRGNQLMALLGSRHSQVDINVATMDCSMASDSVTQKVCQDILPYNIYQWGEKCRSPYIDIGTGKKLREAITWMTMGHPMTYPVESVIFFCAAVLATCITRHIDVDMLKPKNKLLDLPWSDPYFTVIQTVGDDVTLASDCVEAFTFILQTLGFIVNSDKSYWGSANYRESCGKEYYCGTDVTGLYYPRGTSTNEYAELIGLQHKLADFPQANAFIIDEIYKLRSQVTCSSIDSEYTDIWVPGIGKELRRFKTPRHFTKRSYDFTQWVKSALVGAGVAPEEYEIDDASAVIAMYGDSHRVVDQLIDVREICFKLHGACRRCDDNISDEKISVKETPLEVINFNISFDIFENLSNLTKFIHQSAHWTGDLLQTKLSPADVKKLFDLYPDTFYPKFKQAYVLEDVVEHQEQNAYVTHTGLSMSYPSRTGKDYMEAQKCAYMMRLAKTHSQEENLPWADPTRKLDDSNILDSILGGVQTEVKEKDVLF